MDSPEPQRPGVTNVSELVGNGVEFEIFSGYNPLPEEQGSGIREEGTGKKKPQEKLDEKHNRYVKPATGGSR